MFKHQIAKKTLLLTGVSSVLGMTSCTTKQNQIQEKPNVIYILADDMGYGDIEALNDECKIKTPNLNKLANQGMIFSDAHTSSAVSTPTRYGILTGRYNWRSKLKNGVLGGRSNHLIPNSRTTVASLMKKQGYNTGYIGKWHLGWDWARKSNEKRKDIDQLGYNEDNIDYTKPVKNNPNDLGFDYAYGHCGSLDMAPYVYVENGMPTMVPTKETVNKGKYSWWRKGPTSDDFIHDDVTPNFFRRAIKFVDQKSKENKPYFLYLPLPSPHTPILPTAEFQGKSGINDYCDFVMLVDSYVGKLMDAVEKSGKAKNTMIVFTTDNGCSPAAKFQEMLDKGHSPSYKSRGHKADIYEGGHHVPFIVSWPNVVKAGSKSDEILCTTDLMATLADITGTKLNDNEGEDSYSFLPILQGEDLNEPLREATIHHSINGSFAIRKGDWKLCMCPGSGGWSFPRPNSKEAKTLPKVQLYNLKEDVGEQNNLEAKYPEKVKELKALLTRIILDGRSTKGAVQANDPIKKEWKQIAFTKNI
jgi:arylsulfatase A-like enzyme